MNLPHCYLYPGSCLSAPTFSSTDLHSPLSHRPAASAHLQHRFPALPAGLHSLQGGFHLSLLRQTPHPALSAHLKEQPTHLYCEAESPSPDRLPAPHNRFHSQRRSGSDNIHSLQYFPQDPDIPTIHCYHHRHLNGRRSSIRSDPHSL